MVGFFSLVTKAISLYFWYARHLHIIIAFGIAGHHRDLAHLRSIQSMLGNILIL